MTTLHLPAKMPAKTSLLAAGAMLALTVLGPAGQASAQNTTFASPAFERVWQRTDLPVAQGRVNRTWLWGPNPGASLQEPFAEGKNGTHLVQYFDKARMEINNPDASINDPFYVTNGLLVVEMISGRIQTGVSKFESIGASGTQIAGDAGSDSPSYSALSGVAAVGVQPEHRAVPISPGVEMPAVYINHDGATRALGTSQLPGGANVKSAGFVNETGHNIADVFWTYLNSQGPVLQNGQYANGPLMNWVSATGFPVTEPFWTNINVGREQRLVLFQAFQRRILTYTPTNPDGWKVEMANVGLQYYGWRYQTPSVSCVNVPLRGFGRVWAGNRDVQSKVGCPQEYAPFNKEIAVQTAFQPFEHGTMLWVNRVTYTQEKLIYVFFDDGTFQQFNDTYVDGQPANSGLTPPPGLYEPQRGFGKVWREGTGARVRERLGWATAQEKGAAGAYQRFTGGEMYWTGAINKIFVLFGTVSGTQYPITPPPGGFHYAVYDDTFSP